MPRLSPDKKKELAKDLLDGKLSDKELKVKYGVSRVTISTYRNTPKLINERKDIVKVELDKTLLNTRKERIGDVEALNTVARPIREKIINQEPITVEELAIFLKVIDKKDRIMVSYDNADKIHATFIDARTQTQNILQVTETAAPALIRVLHMWEGRVFSIKAFLEQFQEAVK